VHPVRPPDDELAQAIGEATPSTLPRVLGLAARSAKQAGVRAVASGRWLAEVSVDVAQRLPVRDLDLLMDHHRGESGSALAAELVRSASRASAAVGAATGVAAAVSEANPAGWTTLPFELLGETLVVVAIEMKLVAELHVAARRPIEGTPAQRGAAVARAWAEGRGIRYDELVAGGTTDILGRQARRQLTAALRRRLLMRSGRNLASFAPLLAGAAAGAELNRRATRAVGAKVAASLGLD
jgi:hypothetical protein